MKVKKRNNENAIITIVDNGIAKIKIISPFKVEISNELVKNIITGMY